MRMRTSQAILFAAAAAYSVTSTVVWAQQKEPVKIALIDPLSGGAAAIGTLSLKQLRYQVDELNAKGGLNGQKVEVIVFDNKANPKESLVQAQKAVDSGARFLTQAAGSAVAGALVQFVRNYNERNPGKEVLYLNFGAVDPALTNEKCSYGHFRFDATTDMKSAALVDFIKTRANVKKVYLINQDYAFGQAVQKRLRILLPLKRPDIEVVGDELHALLKVTDFSPYIAKIRASGADTVITSDWAQDFALLLKAAAEAGLKVDWYTYYGYLPGGPTAIRQTGIPDRVFVVSSSDPNEASAEAQAYEKAFRRKVGFGMFQPLSNELRMLAQAAAAAKSTDPMKIAAKLEGLSVAAAQGGTIQMRKADHEASQDLFLGVFGPVRAGQTFDEETTGWGWTTLGSIAGSDTVLPTTCKMERPAQVAAH